MTVEQNIVNQVAGLLTDDPEVVLQSAPSNIPKPPAPRQKHNGTLLEGKKRSKKRRRKQRPAGNPFGESLLSEMDRMIQG